MDREIIERLTIDHALGELNADAAALFETYLAEHSEARTWAKPMVQTCKQAREAIESKTRSLAGEDSPPIERMRRPIGFNGRIAGRWAAVIVITLGIGIGLGRRSTPEAPSQQIVVQAEPAPSPKGWDRVLDNADNGFWQTKALAVTQAKSYEIPRLRRSRTGLWDRYRQSRKEWQYD